MSVYVDQLHRKIEIAKTPLRIISLVPSQSEFLWDIGLRDELIGITKFCIHPEEMFRSKTRVGGTKQINFEKIKELKPDLVIGNKEENEKEQIEELMKHYPVWMSDINNLKGAYEMMVCLGELVGKRKEAGEIKLTIEYSFNKFISERVDSRTLDNRQKHPYFDRRSTSSANAHPFTPPFSQIHKRLSHKGDKKKQKVAYLIWQNPMMVAGTNTFIDHLLNVCGFENIFLEARYPEVTMNDLINKKPDLIFLSSEPYPFKEKHIKQFNEKCPAAKTVLVDGEMFSWYGSRLLHAPDYFRELLDNI